jgi:TonB-linked SusC/RagA family outer membrane protein
MKKLGNIPAIFGHPNILTFLRIMKCTVAILLLACLQVSASGYSQNRITVKLHSVEMKTALSLIERKSDFRFLYNQELVSDLNRVEISAVNEEVTTVLDRLFENTPLSYQVLANNLVVLKPKNTYLADIRVTGKVTSSTGEGIPGVSVAVKGSTVGTSTDAAGNFTITVPENATLVFSSVGFETQEVPVNSRTTLDVSMKESSGRSMDEVVVIGYGTAQKRDLTGSIVKIAGQEVADKPNTNPVASLQNKVPGLSVVNNGIPGQQPDVRIRGTISINSVHPLYVVDGIFQDNIDYLNPNDIESMEILKDPSSLAIFGVKGAPGVIAITTKRAKVGQTIVNFNTSVGTKKLVDKIQLASGDQFRQILTAEGQNQTADDAGDVTITNFINNDLSKWTGQTDWVDALTRTAFFTTNNISVNSSTEKNKFYMGVGYTKDEGLVKHIKYDRVTINLGDEFKINKAIKIGFTVNGSRENLPADGNGPLNAARQIFPIVEQGTKSFFIRDPYGAITDSANFDLYSGLPVLQNSLANPLYGLETTWHTRRNIQYRTVGSVFGEVNFLKNFTFRTTLYADLANQNKRVYTPIIPQWDPGAIDQTYPIFTSNNITKVDQDIYDRRKFQGDYILTYKKDFGDHGLTLTGGATHFYSGTFLTHGEIKQQAGFDPIPNDPDKWYISTTFGDPTTKVASSDQAEQATQSFLARGLYNYKSKYFLNASFRRDGSSGINKVFSKKWQNFWAVGAAWELTREDFMSDVSFFNLLKLKASTGVLGNANLGNRPYASYPTISATSSAVFGNNVVPAYTADYLPDPNLKWETVKSSEVGVEFTAMNNRLNGEINYYDKKTENLLVLYTPSGVLPTLTNNGTISNKGFEFSLGWTQTFSNDLRLNLSGNLTTFKNKVLEIGYPLFADPQYPNQTLTGYPLGYFYGYVVEGVYQTTDEIAKSPLNTVNGGGAKPGDLKYKDLDGNNVVNDLDRQMIGNPTPDFIYGFSADLNYKGFDLGVDFGGSSGNEIYRYWGTSEQKNSVYNYPAYYINAWHGEGTSNAIPIVNAKHLINRAPSTYGIENGSFIRVRNLTLGYNFRTAVLERAHIKSFRVFVNVQNVKTWKHNIGYSPEYGGSFVDQAITGDETQRAPSATSFGIDAGDAQGALPRVITAGLNVNF